MKGVSKAHFFCRECYEEKKDMSNCLHINKKRNIETHNSDIEQIVDKHFHGVVNRSPLLDIRQFDITKDLPHDPMHILNEGLAKYHLIDVLQFIIDGPDRRATLEDINTNIKFFNFGVNQSKNRPSGIKPSILEDNPSLSMTASQTGAIIMLFPFIFDDIVDINHSDYKFFNYLRLIMLITYSTKIESHHLELLQATIKKYYKRYIEHPTLSNVPKLHYLGHLVDSIKRYVFISFSGPFLIRLIKALETSGTEHVFF